MLSEPQFTPTPAVSEQEEETIAAFRDEQIMKIKVNSQLTSSVIRIFHVKCDRNFFPIHLKSKME